MSHYIEMKNGFQDIDMLFTKVRPTQNGFMNLHTASCGVSV